MSETNTITTTTDIAEQELYAPRALYDNDDDSMLDEINTALEAAAMAYRYASDDDSDAHLPIAALLTTSEHFGSAAHGQLVGIWENVIERAKYVYEEHRPERLNSFTEEQDDAIMPWDRPFGVKLYWTLDIINRLTAALIQNTCMEFRNFLVADILNLRHINQGFMYAPPYVAHTVLTNLQELIEIKELDENSCRATITQLPAELYEWIAQAQIEIEDDKNERLSLLDERDPADARDFA